MPTIRPSLTRVRPFLLSLLLLAILPTLARSQNAPSDSECCFYILAGTLWHDQNLDTIKQGAEPVLPGWTVECLDVSNTVVATTTTNGAGAYSFSVPVGCGATFKIRQVVPSGWSQDFPLSNGWHTGVGNAQFDATMKAALPEDKLRRTWADVTTAAGAFQVVTGSTAEKSGEFAKWVAEVGAAE